MAVLYVVAAWLIMQVAEVMVTLASLPGWTGQALLLLLAVGFPIALIFSWFYELTPEGISLESEIESHESITHITGRRMDFVVISLLCAAVILFAYDKWWTPAPAEQSIAVLPFENMSDDPGQEYFSDGISEEILNLLAQVPEMRVTSRSSAFSFKGQNLDVPTMAAKLNVAHVLEGSVRKSGNQLRITAQLIEAATDTHLWSESYDRNLEDVFAIQDEIAAAVVNELKITLLGDKPRSTETNPEAYALYLQARHFMNQVTPETNKKAETLLEQALEIDPGFAPAWTRLSNVFRIQANSFGLRPIHEGNEMARHAIQKALDIDPQYGPAYASLASIEMNYDWDFVAADEHLRQARALNPGDFFILLYAAELSGTLGRIDEAIDLYSQAVALDPVSVFGHVFLGESYYSAHRLDEAAESIRFAISLNPSAYGGHYLLGLVLLAQGDAPAALAAMEQETWHALRVLGTALVQHALGDEVASDAAFQELLECCAAGGEYQVATVYAFRGEIDNAFHWLDQAYANRDPGLTNMLNSRSLANLHDDPRWEPLLDKMGLPHE
jgi:TolB-like protein/tetratricopeptide (TPR) repeat protein